jgi:hypothetical protein
MKIKITIIKSVLLNVYIIFIIISFYLLHYYDVLNFTILFYYFTLFINI